MNPTLYIVVLAKSFPCLRHKLEDWYPARFDADAFHSRIGAWSHGEQLCALFVLNVWNPAYAKQKGWHFNLLDFISIADFENQAALMDWMNNPVFP